MMPEATAEHMDWFNELQRVSTNAVRINRKTAQIDVWARLPLVSHKAMGALDAWLNDAAQSGWSLFHRLVRNIRRDYEAHPCVVKGGPPSPMIGVLAQPSNLRMNHISTDAVGSTQCSNLTEYPNRYKGIIPLGFLDPSDRLLRSQ